MKAPSVRIRTTLTCCAAATALLAVFLVSATDKPGIAQAQQAQAEQLTSVSNLRQIGLAFVEYAQGHDDRLPDANHWIDELLPFLLQNSKSDAERQERTRLLFHDPAAPAGQTWSYAFNRALSGARLSTIKDQANVVVLFESTQGIKNASDGGETVPHPGWHGGQVDVCCADGRVKSLPDADVTTHLTFHPQSAAAVTRGIGVRVYLRSKGQTITSDLATYNQSAKTITFSGHVQVKDDSGETIQASSLTLRLPVPEARRAGVVLEGLQRSRAQAQIQAEVATRAAQTYRQLASQAGSSAAQYRALLAQSDAATAEAERAQFTVSALNAQIKQLKRGQ